MEKKRRPKVVRQRHRPVTQFDELKKLMDDFYSRYDHLKGVALERRLWAQAEFGRKEALTVWDSNGPRGKQIDIQRVESFDARGMQRIYGRGDGWPHRSFNMDVWIDSSGQVFARFSSRSSEVERRSYQVFGLKPVPPDADRLPAYSEKNVPSMLRFAYDSWIADNF